MNLNNNITYEIHEWVLDFHQYGKKTPLEMRALKLLTECLTKIEDLEQSEKERINSINK